MGGKKKTKWRKLPPEDLSNITVKRRDGERTWSGGHHTNSGDSVFQNPSYNCPSEKKEVSCYGPDETKFSSELNGNAYPNELTETDETKGQFGFYVNGIWIPLSEVQNTASVNQVSSDGFHTVPIVLHHHLASISPSSFPRFQTFHTPEFSYHPNYFVPNNNHYFYYLTRLPLKPTDIQTSESSSFSANSVDYPYYTVPSADLQLVEENVELPEGLKPQITDNSNFDGRDTIASENDKVYQSNLDQPQHLIDLPFEGPEDIHAAYRYPGYGFGHPVYNVPVWSVFPPANLQAVPSPPWPVVHLQKRRKKRRKGYAEYAIIPKKKNILLSVRSKAADAHDTATKSVPDESKPETKDIRNPENLNTATKENACLVSEYTEQHIHKSESDKSKVVACTNEEVLLYVNDLVENIIHQAVQKYITQFEYYCNISSAIPVNTVPATTVNSKDNEVNSIIAEELLQYILNKVVEESNKIASTLKTCTTYEASRKLKPEENVPRENQDLDQKCDCLIDDKNRCNFACLNEYKDVAHGDQSECAILSTPVTQNTIEDFNDPKLNLNEMLTKSVLIMDFPRVHKKIFSSSESGSISLHETTEVEIQDAESTKSKGFNHITSSSIVLKPVTMLQANTTSEHNSNGEDFLHQNVNTIEQNSNHAQKLNGLTENEIKNMSNLDKQIDNDQIVLAESELPSYCNNSKDHKQLKKLTGICKETMKLENNDSAINNSYLLNELNDSSRQYDYSPSSQYSFVSHSVSSEALIRETEIELNKIRQLTSNSNQSIYKLAYDENITDQSENEDLDTNQAVPKEEEPTCPKSCKNLQIETCHSEILVHEVDSASDAGSEDVELLPHRYESDSTKGCDKHIYVNNLSLAVELLRTRESLPYDDEFKRIVNEDVEGKSKREYANNVDLSLPLGVVNKGFVEDTNPISSASSRITNHRPTSFSQTDVIQDVHGKLRHSITDSGVQSEDSGDEIGEEAKETFDKQNDVRCTSSPNANYRRFGTQAGQRFNIYNPRPNVMNPCFCCIIM